MKINKKELTRVIKEVIMEMELQESDIIAKEKSQWEEMKGNFKKKIKSLIDNIEDDNYKDAEGDIESAIKTLRFWKKRIEKNLNDSSRG